MNYARIYDQIIDRARNRKLSGYSEWHHVIPKCMGGSDDEENLVQLTPEEHFVAHQLLVKMFPAYPMLALAVKALCMDRDKVRLNNKLFGWVRRKVAKALSDARKGKSRPAWIIEKMRAGSEGRPLSKSHRKAISDALKGKRKSAEHSANLSAALMGRPGPRLGHTTPVETRAKQRAAALGRRHTTATLEKLKASSAQESPERRSARAHKAWETKRRKAELISTVAGGTVSDHQT